MPGCAPAAYSYGATAPQHDEVKEQLLDYHERHYERDIADVLGDAEAHVAKRAEQVTKPALVLDIDETSLSNWPNISANNFGFIPEGSCDALPDGPCGFKAWVGKASAKTIAPTLALFNLAKARGSPYFSSLDVTRRIA